MNRSLIIFFLFYSFNSYCQNIISTTRQAHSFTLSDSLSNTSIYVDAKEEMLVRKAATLFSEDIERVTGRKPAIINRLPAGKNLIIIGTVQSSLIQQLIRN